MALLTLAEDLLALPTAVASHQLAQRQLSSADFERLRLRAQLQGIVRVDWALDGPLDHEDVHDQEVLLNEPQVEIVYGVRKGELVVFIVCVVAIYSLSDNRLVVEEVDSQEGLELAGDDILAAAELRNSRSVEVQFVNLEFHSVLEVT